MPEAITITGINKFFGHFQALNNVSFSVEQGEFFALLGPNGAGKTTLISSIAGLAHQSSGTIQVMGFDTIKQAKQARLNLGVVPQELVFDPFLSVRETLRFQSGYFGLKNNEKWIDELLEGLGLSDKANSNMRALSGGMKRRVMVAQALVHKPPVIILDEPTAGVDVDLRRNLWVFVSQLNAQGHTIVLTTHYLEEAEALCNRIAILKKGELIALKPKAELLNQNQIKRISLTIAPNCLPEALKGMVQTQNENQYILALSSLADIEIVLSHLRQDQVKVIELKTLEADLEQVFVNIVNAEQAS